MSCVIKSDLPIAFLSNDRDFPELIKWVQSIPGSHLPQNYLAIAFVIQQEIEPIIRKKEPQIEMQGNVLPSKITQSKKFNFLRKEVFPSKLDPAFLPLINSAETPLRDSIILTKTEEKVNSISKNIIFVGCMDKDQSTLEYFCRGVIQEINRVKDSIQGSFSVSAQASVSESPCLPHLADSAHPHLLVSSHDVSTQSLAIGEQPVFTLEPKKGVILERHFDHGEFEEARTQLSVALEGDEIVTTQENKFLIGNFTDLRYKSVVKFSL